MEHGASEIADNEKIENLKNLGIITDENIQQFYMWKQAELDEESLNSIKLKDDEFFLVNYETEEVIYSEGYTDEDGNTYYQLSQTLDL